MLDEPIIGLHIPDIDQLTRLLRRFVDAANTVIVIKHNLEVVDAADRVIDLGPDAGHKRKRVVLEGAVADLGETQSYTGRYLRRYLG